MDLGPEKGQRMGREFWNAVDENPIIAAVKSMVILNNAVSLKTYELFLFCLEISVRLETL